MTKAEWEKNDDIVRSALEKMHLCLLRDFTTRKVNVYANSNNYEYICYAEDGSIIACGPIDPEMLGEIKYFVGIHGISWKFIDNIFFGIKNYEELKIKLDLMA